MKNVAVQGFSYQISNPIVNAVVVLTGVPSLKCKAGGNGICKDQFSAMISAITAGPATIPDPGPYTVNFSATATKVKADGTLVLRVDDTTGDVNATPKVPGNPPTPNPVSFHLKIVDAGQMKVRAE